MNRILWFVSGCGNDTCLWEPLRSPIHDLIFGSALVSTFTFFLCALVWLKVRFVVGGDGPKHVRLEEMREKHSLQDRVETLGAVSTFSCALSFGHRSYIP